MKRLKMDSVIPGDIILTARPGAISQVIRAATNGAVSHAMLCVQFASFIDSTSDGVQARNLQRELFDDEEVVFHFRLKDPPQREVIERIVEFARAEIGTRYSVREALRSVAAFMKPRTRQQFCSRLVAQAYRHAGIELVPDPDYCSPEDLLQSPLLIELAVETEPVTAEEQEWWSGRENLITLTHDAQNAVLSVARSIDPDLENFGDIYRLLIEQPTADEKIAIALQDSGYLNIWKMEVDRNPWRYEQGLMEKLEVPTEYIKKYCVDTISEAYSGGLRYSINLVQLQALGQHYPRKSIKLLIDLYGNLVLIDERRRECACSWLNKYYPSDFAENIEQIEPHSRYWWSVVERVEPTLAALSHAAVEANGTSTVCSSCGDEPAADYRLVNGAAMMPGVPSLRLCGDCVFIRRRMGNILEAFFQPRHSE